MTRGNGAHFIKVNGKSYQVSYGSNSIAELEDALGCSFMELAQNMGQRKVGHKELRALIWAGLLQFKSGNRIEVLTIYECGDLLDEITSAGNDKFSEVLQTCMDAFSSAMPKQEKTDSGK